LATRGNGQRTIGLVVGGVGIAGLGVGTVFGIVAMGKTSDLDTQKTDASREGFDTTKSDAKSAATISTVGFIAGAALVAGGAALYFTAPKSGTQTATRASLVPAVGPQGSGLLLRGAW
jgi:serine/threonine-protein kinase